MPTATDWTLPGTVSTGIEGERPWADLANAKACDGAYASSYTSTGQPTEYLQAHNFDFAVPSEVAGQAVNIIGYEVRVTRKAASSSAVTDYGVYLHLNGELVVSGDNQATGDYWDSADETVTYGGQYEAWGRNLTIAQVNQTAFGVAIAAQRSGSRVNTYIDCVEMRVFYETVGSGLTSKGFKRHNPGCKCCEEVDPPPCGLCSEDPGDLLSVTLGGFVSALCNCGFYNATFLLQRNPSNPCHWTLDGTEPCGYGSTLVWWMSASIRDIGFGMARFEVTVTHYTPPYGHPQTVIFRNESATPYPCASTRSLSRFSWGGFGLNCYLSTTTCQIN